MGRPQHTCFKPLQKGGRGAPCLLRGFEDHPPTPPAPHSPSVLTAQMISLSERPAHCTGFVMPLFVIIKQGKAASIQYGLKIWARDQVLVGNTTAISLPQPLELCVHSWNIITSSLQPSLDHWFSTSQCEPSNQGGLPGVCFAARWWGQDTCFSSGLILFPLQRLETKTPDHLHPNLLPSDSLQPRHGLRQPANSQAAARGRTRSSESPGLWNPRPRQQKKKKKAHLAEPSVGTSWRGEGWQGSPGWSESLHDLQCGQNVRMLVLAPGHVVNKKANILAAVRGLVLTMTKLHCLEIFAFPLPKLDPFAWPLTRSSKSLGMEFSPQLSPPAPFIQAPSRTCTLEESSCWNLSFSCVFYIKLLL